jgi:TRAP-type C4-dicarboxylate transport system permease small subunit
MLNKLMGHYCKVLSVVMVVCLAAMVFMVFGNVVLRYGFNSGITVSEELSRWAFLWVVFLGATVAVHEKAHMGVDSLVTRLPPVLRKAVLLVGYLLMLLVTWLMFSGSLAQTASTGMWRLPSRAIPWPGLTAVAWCLPCPPGSCS